MIHFDVDRADGKLDLVMVATGKNYVERFTNPREFRLEISLFHLRMEKVHQIRKNSNFQPKFTSIYKSFNMIITSVHMY